MTTKRKAPYSNDPLFKTAMEKFQTGEWETGLAALDDVQKEYPNAKDLGKLREEIILKTHLDEDELVDNKKDRSKELIKIGIRVGVAALVLVSIFLGIRSINTWITTQWTNIQDDLFFEIQNIEVAIQFRDAQSYLQANHPEAALGILEEISNSNPDYPGLDALIDEANGMTGLRSQYDAAVQLIEQGDLLTALDSLEEINEEHPDFLDVSIKIQEIEGEFYLLDLLDQAETAYENEEWELASSTYETLRAIAPTYRPELVEQRLTRSYMNYAAKILEDEAESPRALQLADTYFRKALVLNPRDEGLLTEQTRVKEQFKERLFQHYVQAAIDTIVGHEDSLAALGTANKYLNNALLLKPNDRGVLREINLAKAYLQAQVDFDSGGLHQAISNLEYIYSVEPSYANGTALQTLYETYMDRGAIYSATGELEAALNDFQGAAEIAIQTKNPILKLYFAKIKIGETMGVLNNYPVAVNNFREAVELVNLQPLLDAEDANLSYLLREAERFAGIEWYRTSYRLYRRVLPATDLILDKEEVITIQEGDYLSSLAKAYETTVEEILRANALPSAGNIQLGQTIVIPTLKEIDK